MVPSRIARSPILVAAAVLLLGSVVAQPPPYVPPELYQEQRRLQEDRITFCIWEVNPTADLDRMVAQEIAAALLVEAEFYVFDQRAPLTETFWETVFIHLAERCDVLSGFKIVPEGYPEWLIPSRPYYEAPYVLAVTNEEWSSLADIPPDRVVGSQILTLADYNFQDYLRSIAEDRRWRRFPYTSGEVQLTHLEQGTIAGALIWAPTLHELTGGDPATRGIHLASLNPLPEQTTLVGLILREYNSLLRAQLDDAIAALIQDGVIDRLLEEHGLPGRAPRGR